MMDSVNFYSVVGNKNYPYIAESLMNHMRQMMQEAAVKIQKWWRMKSAFRKADKDYQEKVGALKAEYGIVDEAEEEEEEEEAEEEVKYETCYSVQLFSKVAGNDISFPIGVYIQTYGGGPEGGYVFAQDGNVYEVNREWFQPFTFKLFALDEEYQVFYDQECPDHIRFAKVFENPKDNEGYFDVKEWHSELWAEAELMMDERLAEEYANRPPFISDSDESSSASESPKTPKATTKAAEEEEFNLSELPESTLEKLGLLVQDALENHPEALLEAGLRVLAKRNAKKN